MEVGSKELKEEVGSIHKMWPIVHIVVFETYELQSDFGTLKLRDGVFSTPPFDLSRRK